MQTLIDSSRKTILLQRNEFLSKAGNIDTHIYYVAEGSLRIFRCDEHTEQNIRFGYRGNLLVALDSFLSGQTTEYYIQALKKTKVNVITQEAFRDYIQHHPGDWIRILEDLAFQQMEREADLLTQSPRERYHRVFRRSPQLFQEIPLKHIANYLRMSPETLSRLKKS